MHHSGGWKGSDLVHNAWLLSNKSRRKWFPHKCFTKPFPDWEEEKI